MAKAVRLARKTADVSIWAEPIANAVILARWTALAPNWVEPTPPEAIPRTSAVPVPVVARPVVALTEINDVTSYHAVE